MYAEAELDEYLDEIRERVCSRCVERPPGGPPCAPLGKMCGVELHLPLYVEAVHGVESNFIEPYLDNIHESVCSQCVQHDAKGCPCPLEYLPILVVQAIETVDQRRRQDRAQGRNPCGTERAAEAVCSPCRVRNWHTVCGFDTGALHLSPPRERSRRGSDDALAQRPGHDCRRT